MRERIQTTTRLQGTSRQTAAPSRLGLAARFGAVLALTSAAAVALSATAAVAAPTAPSRQVAYVRAGNIYTSSGSVETRLTTAGKDARPRFSPNGRRIAYLRANILWVMNANGSAQQQLTNRPAGGASWSPDGKWLAFAAPGCTGGPSVYKISATTPGTVPQVLFPTECRSEPVPAPAAPVVRTGGLVERMASDDAVSWSPNGSQIAFRGGQCESTYDACLTVGTVSTGAETTMAAYGGGGRDSGFATVPAWRTDGRRLSWTSAQTGATSLPVHVVEFDLVTRGKRILGTTADREMSYVNATQALLTGQHQGSSWVFLLNATTGARTAFHAGSQPSAQPMA